MEETDGSAGFNSELGNMRRSWLKALPRLTRISLPRRHLEVWAIALLRTPDMFKVARSRPLMAALRAGMVF